MATKRYSIKDFLEIKSSHSPSINFDGSYIVFLNNNSGTSQLYLFDRKEDKITQLTDYADYIAGAVFSPTENIVIFGKAEGGNEKTQLFLLDITTKEVTPLTTNTEVKYGFDGFSTNGKKILLSSNERNGTDLDIFIMDLATKESTVVFAEGGYCTGKGFSSNDNYVIISKFDSNVNNDLYLVDLKTNKSTQITNHDVETVYDGPQWLGDESGFFVTTNLDKDFLGIAFYELKTNQFSYKVTPDWDVDEFILSKDDTKLGYIVNEDGYNRLYLVSTKDFTEILPAPFTNGLFTSISFDQSAHNLSFGFLSAVKPRNVYVWDLKNNITTKFGNSSCPIPEETFVEPALIRYKSFDGLEISAFLYTTKENNNAPAVVSIHGGPESQYQPIFSALTQFLIYNGYVVITPNVRGSSGYGKHFLSLDNIEKRLDSVKDIEYLVKHLNESQLVNPEKIAVMGGSYGGFMVLACMCFYPELFVAGVDIVGIANLVTFLENTAPHRRALRESEYGYLDQDRKFLESISPINHIEKIIAPLMVIHGANDPRVPLNEAHQVKDKLKKLGRKVELLVYEDEGHGLGKLKNILDAYPKIVQFLDKILKA